jgi:hypothetical protein
MSSLALVALGAVLGGCLVPLVAVALAEIAWRLEDRRERAALRAAARAERRRGEVERPIGQVAVLSEHRRRA